MNVALKTPDSLWVKVEGFLGVDVGTLWVEGERVLFYSPWENVAYEGSIQNAGETTVLPLDLSPTGFVLGVMGLLVPQEKLLDSLRNFSVEGRRYLFELGDGEQIWVEPKGPVVSRWEKRDENGDIIWTWEGEHFRKTKGVLLPRMIRVTEYNPKQQVTLFYEAVKTNRPMRDDWCKIRLPEGVETVEL